MKNILRKFEWLANYYGVNCKVNYKTMMVRINVGSKRAKFIVDDKWSVNRLCRYIDNIRDEWLVYEMNNLDSHIYILRKSMSLKQLQSLITSFERSGYNFEISSSGRITLHNYNTIEKDDVVIRFKNKRITFMELIDLSLKLRMEEAV